MKIIAEVKRDMEDPQTWQELLRSIISDPLEHQRIAHEIGVNPVTLTRWAHQTSVPRMANLRPLLDAIPRHRQRMQILLQKDFPKIAPEGAAPDEIVSEIPSPFYSSIINIYTTSPPILRSSTICITIFQQMLRHLDPLKQGLQVIVFQAVPPNPGEKIHSLRMVLGRATLPWESQVENLMAFAGMESQVGNTVIRGHALITQTSKEHDQLYPGHKVPYAQSIATYPLLYFDRIAGVIAITSTQPHYFTPAHMELMQSYAELLILAFEQEQFYFLRDFHLGVMPSTELQQAYLENFQHRVTEMMREAEKHGQQLKRTEAEQWAWKNLEEILLHLSR